MTQMPVLRRRVLAYVFVLSCTVLVAIGAFLVLFVPHLIEHVMHVTIHRSHAYLISLGQTTIEMHRNAVSRAHDPHVCAPQCLIITNRLCSL